jgi:multisubunit Na+/H+ antiporter MnhC subunit
MTLFRGTGVLVALGLVGLAAYINVQSLVEAYGSGPPYFGRTTNMDKWSSPLPALLMLDALVLLIAVVAILQFLRRKQEHAALSTVPEPSEIAKDLSDGADP